MLSYLICLPLFEAEPNSFMRIVLVVRLVFVVLDANEFGIYSLGVQRKRNQCIDGRSLRYNTECPGLKSASVPLGQWTGKGKRRWRRQILEIKENTDLLVTELYQVSVVLDNLVALILAGVEQLW